MKDICRRGFSPGSLQFRLKVELKILRKFQLLNSGSVIDWETPADQLPPSYSPPGDSKQLQQQKQYRQTSSFSEQEVTNKYIYLLSRANKTRSFEDNSLIVQWYLSEANRDYASQPCQLFSYCINLPHAVNTINLVLQAGLRKLNYQEIDKPSEAKIATIICASSETETSGWTESEKSEGLLHRVVQLLLRTSSRVTL